MKGVGGQEKENKTFQGGHTKVKGSGKTDLKKGLLKGEAKYTFKWCSYLSNKERASKDTGKPHGSSALSNVYRKRYNPLPMLDKADNPQVIVKCLVNAF